jgi:hypothetical protein
MGTNRDLSGILGKNTRKTQDNHPEYSGNCLINGVEYWISAWVKEGQYGKFFSLSFKPKIQPNNNVDNRPLDNKQNQQSSPPQDDLPF